VLPTFRFVLGDLQLTLSLHALAVLLGVLAGVILAARRAPVAAPVVLAAALVASAGLAGAQALYRALHGGHHGLASTGAVWAGLVATWATARLLRLDPRALLDLLAPAGLLALAVGRVGCFLGGCCYGRPTSLPWGIVFPELGLPPRHPLQLYSAAADLGLVLLMPRTAPPGAVARRACVGWGCARAALELLRDPGATDVLPGGWLTVPQVAALLLAAGAALSPRLHLQEPSTMPRPRRKSVHGR